jgi:hypothetical protein
MENFWADPHVNFILAAYGVWLFAVLGLMFFVFLQKRQRAKNLQKLEAPKNANTARDSV